MLLYTLKKWNELKVKNPVLNVNVILTHRFLFFLSNLLNSNRKNISVAASPCEPFWLWNADNVFATEFPPISFGNRMHVNKFSRPFSSESKNDACIPSIHFKTRSLSKISFSVVALLTLTWGTIPIASILLLPWPLEASKALCEKCWQTTAYRPRITLRNAFQSAHWASVELYEASSSFALANFLPVPKNGPVTLERRIVPTPLVRWRSFDAAFFLLGPEGLFSPSPLLLRIPRRESGF